MKVRVLFHDNCFDGMCSAGLFSEYLRTREAPDAEILFGGLAHGPEGGLSEARLDGDVNAVVDFRYIADPRLTWWFDHHRSAFRDEADRAHFEARTDGRVYYDPTAPSCAGFLARTLAAERGFDVSRHAELVRWADLIDAARFPDPATAVELKEPALRLMLWIEHSRDFGERVELIDRLVHGSLADAAAAPFVKEKVDALFEAHWDLVERFRARARLEGGVVYCDLTDREVAAVNKFIPYYLYPDAQYAVVVSVSPTRAKVSVGFSPWQPADARHRDIAALCERYGGGGHPVVGAVSLARDRAEDAVRVGREMVAALRR